MTGFGNPSILPSFFGGKIPQKNDEDVYDSFHDETSTHREGLFSEITVVSCGEGLIQVVSTLRASFTGITCILCLQNEIPSQVLLQISSFVSQLLTSTIMQTSGLVELLERPDDDDDPWLALLRNLLRNALRVTCTRSDRSLKPFPCTTLLVLSSDGMLGLEKTSFIASSVSLVPGSSSSNFLFSFGTLNGLGKTDFGQLEADWVQKKRGVDVRSLSSGRGSFRSGKEVRRHRSESAVLSFDPFCFFCFRSPRNGRSREILESKRNDKT